MTQSETDPRVIRTRNLIMDSFFDLSGKKEFTDITVKDITTEAMINRATFYYHFEDKYDLLDKVLSELLMINLSSDIFEKRELNEQSITSIFTSVTDFQRTLPTRCQIGYEDTIGRIIKEQLNIIFYKMLLKQHSTEDKQALEVTAVILSWGIYGASFEWRRDGKNIPPDKFIKSAIPYIMLGINFDSSKGDV